MSALDDLQYSVPSDFKDSFHPLCSDARQTNFADGHMETTNSLTWMRALNGALQPNCNAWTDLSVINLPSQYHLCCFDSDEILMIYEINHI